MSAQVWLVFFFTFIIHLIGTLSFALRIAGARTRKIALSFALFNILALASRTAHSFQVPLLAKHVEQNILQGTLAHAEADFRWLLLAATLATVLGALLIPTFQRLLTRAVEAFDVHRSLPRLVARSLSRSGFRQFKESWSWPAKENLTLMMNAGRVPLRIIVANVLATALISVGAFSSLYAGYLNPALRVTANSFSPLINGFSTVLLFVYIDPFLSLLTDDVAHDKVSHARFRSCVILFVLSRLAGTLIAQLLFIPASKLIVAAARLL
ncbi:MAG: lipid II flippase Amj family protein [Pyrinomonadaceae bacterium]